MSCMYVHNRISQRIPNPFKLLKSFWIQTKCYQNNLICLFSLYNKYVNIQVVAHFNHLALKVDHSLQAL